MEPPIGFIRLRDAADIVGDKLYASDWQPLAEMAMAAMSEMNIPLVAPGVIAHGVDPDIDHVIILIAEKCRTGAITAAYRTLRGADDLELSVWRAPDWRNYFATGEIWRVLPLLEPGQQPDANGFTTRWPREIFLDRAAFDDFVKKQAPAAPRNPTPRASEARINRALNAYETSRGSTHRSENDFLRFARETANLTVPRRKLQTKYQQRFGKRRRGRIEK
jgi:hypothetical protein